MPQSNYWQDRFTMLQEAQLKKGEDYLSSLEKEFNAAQASMQKQIEVWYQRFADNNQISLTEAKIMLAGRDLKEFKWDVKEYIKHGEDNALDPKWMKELENASARVHISRLEALKLQTQHQMEVLYGNHIDGADKLMRGIYEDGYYHTAYEIQKGFNVGYDLHKVNSDQISKVISKPWTTDNKTFSDRIWGSKQELINQVHTSLTQGIIRGDTPRQAIEALAQKMGVKKNQAGRLIMTESAFFASASQRDAFKDLDVELYEVVATLDRRTSEICQGLDGKIFNLKDFQVGITAPPFHVWCRSVTVPWFDDLGGSRAARGADGKTYYVPSDMKYDDWHKTFINGGSKADLKQVVNGGIIEPITLENIVANVRDKIAANGGVVTEGHLKEVGKEVRLDLMSKRTEVFDQMEAIKKEMEAFKTESKFDELDKERRQLSMAMRGLKDPSELGMTADQVTKRYHEIMPKMNELNAKESDLRQRLSTAESKYRGSQTDNSIELSDTIERFRDVGNGKLNVDAHLENSRSPMRTLVKNAYDYYPTDWVKASVDHGTLTPKTVDRGYYSHYRGEIAISGRSDSSKFETAIHELGHRFERINPAILKAEKEFYERRTSGESLQWLGGGYSRDEKSRFDKFLNHYMGKDYGGSAYELVSMGFQHAYLDPTQLWKDEDYCDWIYGILTLL